MEKNLLTKFVNILLHFIKIAYIYLHIVQFLQFPPQEMDFPFILLRTILFITMQTITINPSATIAVPICPHFLPLYFAEAIFFKSTCNVLLSLYGFNSK